MIGKNTNILAIDLGTQTAGWAWGDGRGMVVSGTWDFSKGHESPQLARQLQKIKADFGVAHIYVAVPNAGRRDFGLKGLCKRLDLPCEAIRESDLKKFWTGNGRASKEAMIAEAVRRDYEPFDHKEATALALMDATGIEDAA